jgi:ATP-dependent RNA helicase DBP3
LVRYKQADVPINRCGIFAESQKDAKGGDFIPKRSKVYCSNLVRIPSSVTDVIIVVYTFEPIAEVHPNPDIYRIHVLLIISRHPTVPYDRLQFSCTNSILADKCYSRRLSFIMSTTENLCLKRHLKNQLPVMLKRDLEDAGLTSNYSETSSSRPAKKKIRKESKISRDSPAITEASTAVNSEKEKETREERKERKRLKKIKKLEKGAGGASDDLVHTVEHVDKSTQVTRKADRARSTTTEQSGLRISENVTDAALIASKVHPTPLTSNQTGNSYTEHAHLTGLDQTQIDKFMEEHFISITDPKPAQKAFRPITKFSYLPISDPAQQEPFKTFQAPTPIQAAAWPFLFAGRDVIGVAETGSGKTMAFAVPCVRYITSLPGKFTGAKAVVVCPTRELAMQSYEQVTKLATVAGIKAVCVYGGVPKDEQRKALKNADIVVATPGRLNDLINEGSADLGRVGYVVLDEADRMLDKGFEEEIRKIINTTLPLGKRQTLMFTATWPESVRALATTFMTSPVKIAIGDNPSGDLRANARIVQKVEVLDPRNKEYRLLQLLKQYQSGSQKDDRILVFCLYKKEATRVESFIRSKGIRVAGIHGDLSQEQRTKSLDAFKKGNTPVLVATDVAARGLDIPAVKLVINCTFPLTVEDYVHRIGRTGRAGKDGLAITLFTEHDKAQSGA